VVDGRPVEGGESSRQTLSGTGTSPGRVQGRARIVKEPSTADLRQGDILIAEHTDPGWTPLLRLVGAVVTEEGGMLNHCSIVARELGIPAVVGIEGATRRIREGTLVSVDGSAGAVHIANQQDDPAGRPG
jgi:pyruvate,water dikinase